MEVVCLGTHAALFCSLSPRTTFAEHVPVARRNTPLQVAQRAAANGRLPFPLLCWPSNVPSPSPSLCPYPSFVSKSRSTCSCPNVAAHIKKRKVKATAVPEAGGEDELFLAALASRRPRRRRRCSVVCFHHIVSSQRAYCYYFLSNWGQVSPPFLFLQGGGTGCCPLLRMASFPSELLSLVYLMPLAATPSKNEKRRQRRSGKPKLNLFPFI